MVSAQLVCIYFLLISLLHILYTGTYGIICILQVVRPIVVRFPLSISPTRARTTLAIINCNCDTIFNIV